MREYRRKIYDKEVNKRYKKRYKDAHPDRVKEQQKKYKLDPEIKAARKAERKALTEARNQTPEAIEFRKSKARENGKKWRKANKEKVALRAKEYGKKNRDRLREKDRERRAANPERYKKQHQEYYRKNKDKLCESKKEWIKNNPNHRSEVDRRRRARKANNGYEKYTEEQVLLTYGSNCHICLNPIDLTAERQTGRPGWEEGLHIDHYIPIAKGGPDTLANVRPSHGRCNLLKHTDIPEKATA
jgi:hypothetical protein